MRLTAVQSSILLALGLQRKTIKDVEVYLFIAFLHLHKADSHLMNLTGRTPAACVTCSCVIHQDCPNRLMDIQKAAISAQLPDASLTVLNTLLIV